MEIACFGEEECEHDRKDALSENSGRGKVKLAEIVERRRRRRRRRTVYPRRIQRTRLVFCRGGQDSSFPESPQKVRFLFRVGEVIGAGELDGWQTLGGWLAGVSGEGWDGYFATVGGKVLVLRSRWVGLAEVVYRRRMRRGAFGGVGKGAGGAVAVPGQRVCSNCSAQDCWNTRHSCCRCGVPRHFNGGGGCGQGGVGKGWAVQGGVEGCCAGGFPRGGLAGQGGVGGGMDCAKVIGPTGRNQTLVPAGNPTFRKGPNSQNKVGGAVKGGVPGAGVGGGGWAAWDWGWG